jgi:uncharacterized membrane protein YhaH (DUF805 family)
MSKLFSFNGRIRRTEYLVTNIVASFIGMIIFFVLGAGMMAGGEVSGASGLFLFIAYIALMWVLFAAGAKRCHDRGNSGAYQLIPFYGLWMLFGDGEHGSNRYGDDPKGRVGIREYSAINQQSQQHYN